MLSEEQKLFLVTVILILVYFRYDTKKNDLLTYFLSALAFSIPFL